MADDYVIRQKSEILTAFADSPVVLVEISSKNKLWNGKIFAISNHNGGFPFLETAIEAGVFDDKTATFGVTVKCVDLMEKFENGYEHSQINTENYYVSPKGYCHKEQVVQNSLENRVVKDISPQNLSYLRYKKNESITPEENKEEESFVEENFGCFLALFLGAVAFIVGIFVWGFIA